MDSDDLVTKNRQRLDRKEAQYQYQNQKVDTSYQPSFYQGYRDGKHQFKSLDGTIRSASSNTNGALEIGQSIEALADRIDGITRVLPEVRATKKKTTVTPNLKYLIQKNIDANTFELWACGWKNGCVKVCTVSDKSTGYTVRATIDSLGNDDFYVTLTYKNTDNHQVHQLYRKTRLIRAYIYPDEIAYAQGFPIDWLFSEVNDGLAFEGYRYIPLGFGNFAINFAEDSQTFTINEDTGSLRTKGLGDALNFKLNLLTITDTTIDRYTATGTQDYAVDLIENFQASFNGFLTKNTIDTFTFDCNTDTFDDQPTIIDDFAYGFQPLRFGANADQTFGISYTYTSDSNVSTIEFDVKYYFYLNNQRYEILNFDFPNLFPSNVSSEISGFISFNKNNKVLMINSANGAENTLYGIESANTARNIDIYDYNYADNLATKSLTVKAFAPSVSEGILLGASYG